MAKKTAKKKTAKRMTRKQVAQAEQSGASVKRPASVVKIDGMEQFTAILKTVQEQQKQILDLIGQTTASLLNGSKGAKDGDLTKAMNRLAKAVERQGVKPGYEFDATRTADGFKIHATPKQPTRH